MLSLEICSSSFDRDRMAILNPKEPDVFSRCVSYSPLNSPAIFTFGERGFSHISKGVMNATQHVHVSVIVSKMSFIPY